MAHVSSLVGCASGEVYGTTNRQPLAKMLILEAPKKLMHRFLDSNIFSNTMCG